jgi:hypothetical protein
MEVTVAEDRYLKIGGTIDMLIKRANGKYAIRDFTFGSHFHDSNESPPFKYGVTDKAVLFANPKNSKKLQMMWYALMMRINDPTIQFEDLEVVYLPTKDRITQFDTTAAVEVDAFLEMIVTYLRNEKPEQLEAIKQGFIKQYGQEQGMKYFNSLWDGSNYDSKLETSVKSVRDERLLVAQLEEKLEMLRTQMLFDFQTDAPMGTPQEIKRAKEKQLAIKEETLKNFEDIMNLLNDDKVNTRNVRDIGWLSTWLASNANQNSEYIQLYDKFFKARKVRAEEKITKAISKFKAMFRPVQEDNFRAYGGNWFKGIPILQNKFNQLGTRQQ